jgi:hypothetical protein
MIIVYYSLDIFCKTDCAETMFGRAWQPDLHKMAAQTPPKSALTFSQPARKNTPHKC